MQTLQELFDAIAADAKAAQQAKQETKQRTQKQALMEELVVAQRAVLAIGEIVLGENDEKFTQTFSEADMAYAGGYLGAISAVLSRLSNFIRTYPEA